MGEIGRASLAKLARWTKIMIGDQKTLFKMALFWSIVVAIAFCQAAKELARCAVSGKISPRVLFTSPPSHPCWPRISPLVAFSGPAPWAPNPGIRNGALGRVARKACASSGHVAPATIPSDELPCLPSRLVTRGASNIARCR